jgi:hypothetical protein
MPVFEYLGYEFGNGGAGREVCGVDGSFTAEGFDRGFCLRGGCVALRVRQKMLGCKVGRRERKMYLYE